MQKLSLLFLGLVLLPALAWGQLTILPPNPPARLDAVVQGQLKIRIAYGVPRQLHVDILGEYGLKKVRGVLPYELSLTYANSMNVVRRFGSQRGVNEEALRFEEPLLRSYVVEYYDLQLTPEQKCARLMSSCSLLEIVEPVIVSQITAVPNDSLVSSQKMLETISVFKAWDIEPGSDSVLIGISDSGVLQEHEDLADALFVNTNEIPDNGIDDDGNGFIDDYNGYNFCTKDDGTKPGNTFNNREGHGTAVAGICGAVTNNAIGIAGIAGKCKLVALKTMPDNSGGIVYGYESILYCALNGIHVVNCSWGSMSKSCIDESVVRYALSRDVAVVAASGNHGTASPFYPCSYRGVLGVGVSDATDFVVSMSGIGPTVDVMAPGEGTKATSNDGTYGNFCCTSGASPIAAGVLGLVRSKYPKLTAIEANALVRETAAPSPWKLIPSNKDSLLLPMGRLDALRAVSMRPDSLPSMEFDTLEIAATNGSVRWTKGDTLSVAITFTSVLAPFTISEIRDVKLTSAAAVGVKILSAPVISVEKSIAHNQQFTLGGITVEVTSETDTATYIVATLVGKTMAGEVFTKRIQMPITPSAAFTTLSNDVLRLSVGDRARIGNTDLDRGQGAGLTYRSWCGQLYEAGLMVASNQRVVDAVRGVRKNNDHFRPKKRFVTPSPLTSIVSDADAPDTMMLGILVEQSVQLATADTGVFVNDITIKNVSDSVISDLAVAYFMDWDLGAQPANNYTTLDTVATHSAVQAVATPVQGEPVVLSAVSSEFSDASPISVGMDNTETYSGFTAASKFEYLVSGTSRQHAPVGDVAVVSGMRFTDGIRPGFSKSFRQIIVIDTLESRAKQLLARYMGAENTPTTLSVGPIAPNPAQNTVYITVKGALQAIATMQVSDLNGRTVMSRSIEAGVSNVRIEVVDVSGLAQGIYRVSVVDGGHQASALLVVTR